MRPILDDLDPIFMATAVMIGGLLLASRLPQPPRHLDHPSLEDSSYFQIIHDTSSHSQDYRLLQGSGGAGISKKFRE